MRHLAILSICFFVLCLSCKKDNSTTPPGQEKKYAVRFSVSDFTQVTGDFGRTGSSSAKTAQDTLREHIHHLFYLVYGNGFVKRIDQIATDPDFGTFTDSLPQGNYTIALVGSLDSVVFTAGYMDFYDEYSILHGLIPGTDVFYKKVVLNVNGPVNEQIALERVVGKVTINIKDMIPAEAKYLVVNPLIFPTPPDGAGFPGIEGNLNLKTGEMDFDVRFSGAYRPGSFTLDAVRGLTNTSFDLYILTLTSRQLAIDIQCTDAAGVELAHTIVNDVRVENNRRTTISGNLFVGQGNSGIGVSIPNPDFITDTTFVAF